MDQTNNGGPAFPCTTIHDFKGMSLRDWFAGQALAGLLAFQKSSSLSPRDFACDAYTLADAMLAERQKERE